MSALAERACAVAVRDALPEDDAALVALAAACPMAGDVTLCVDRAPSFFALTRLEGEHCRVGVAEAGGEIVGCVAASVRTAYLNGRPTLTGYAGDLKVHPAYRGGGAADALERYTCTALRDLGGAGDLPTMLTILAGNRSMERRAAGPRGLPRLARFATVLVHAVPLLWPRAASEDGVRVEPARESDVEEMGALWQRLAPQRQLAPVLDAPALHAWLRRAPGLDTHDYLVARRRDGRIAAFLAVWEQRSFKQLRVLAYSARLGAARAVVNALAPLTRTPRLPAPGAVLPVLATAHLCVPAGGAALLRALVRRAYAARRGGGHAFLTLALDRRDPLNAALRGLHAQPTAVDAYLTTPAGRWEGTPLDGRPLHFESALV